ncbi:MAG: hypothetical protein ACRBB4_07420 [Neptuniibacter sp.]
MNTTRPLKEQIRLKATQEKLDESEVLRLIEMQTDILSQETGKGSINGPFSHRFAAMLASVLVMVMLTAFLWQDNDRTKLQSIAFEVAGNHIKQRPMELHAQSMDQVKIFFKELDFSPTNSDHLLSQFALAESNLMGARYCSIKGVTAAQLRYQESANTHSTLYEVGYDSDLYGYIPDISQDEAPQTLMVKGVKVTIWLEKGLLMALVEDI